MGKHFDIVFTSLEIMDTRTTTPVHHRGARQGLAAGGPARVPNLDPFAGIPGVAGAAAGRGLVPQAPPVYAPVPGFAAPQGAYPAQPPSYPVPQQAGYPTQPGYAGAPAMPQPQYAGVPARGPAYQAAGQQYATPAAWSAAAQPDGRGAPAYR